MNPTDAVPMSYAPMHHEFSFLSHTCWVRPDRVVTMLTDTRDQRRIDALRLGDKLPTAERVLEEIEHGRAPLHSWETKRTTPHIPGVDALRAAGGKRCSASGPHLGELLDTVDALITRLSPAWDRPLKSGEVAAGILATPGPRLVQARGVRPAPTDGEEHLFVYHSSDVWSILRDLQMTRLDRLTFDYPGCGPSLAVALDGTEVHELELHLPRDARRALLVFQHVESAPSPDGRGLIEFVNDLPDELVDLILDLTDSDVWLPSADGYQTPAYVADLWDIYAFAIAPA